VKLVLFDIDGTLMTCAGAGMQAMARAGEALFGERVSFDGIVPAGSVDPHLFRAALMQSDALDLAPEHDRFRARYVEEIERTLAERADGVRAYDGVHALLDEVFTREDDVVPGLLTGNYGQSARTKLRAVGIDPTRFVVTAFGDEAPTRPGLVALAMQRWARERERSVDPSEVVVVGDTPHDVDCALANGCAVLAVATGRYSASELRDAGATVVVDHLADPRPFWDLLAS
jgi:phosphoglycolate phosphatase-like HAD superfamily hydrolase